MTPHFAGPPITLEPIVGVEGRWRIHNAGRGYFVWEDGRTITPTDGDVTDLMSVPRLFWILIPRDYAPLSGAVHDELCKRGVFDDGSPCPWGLGASVFRWAMIVEKGCIWRANLASFAVRAWGWIPHTLEVEHIDGGGVICYSVRPQQYRRMTLAACMREDQRHMHQRGKSCIPKNNGS